MGFLERSCLLAKPLGLHAYSNSKLQASNLKARDPKTRGFWMAHFHRPLQVVSLSVSSEQWLCASGCEPQAGRVLPHRASFWRRRRVTTNSVEGLFGRLKQYLRQCKLARSGSELMANCWQSQHPRRPEAPRYRFSTSTSGLLTCCSVGFQIRWLAE